MKENGKRVLPAGCKWVPMGEFLTLARDCFIIDDDQEYRLVTVKLHGKGIVPRSRLRGSQIKMKEQQRIHANQLLVAEIDAKFGGFGIVPVELEGAIVSGHYFLYNVDTAKVSPQFLECFISSDILTEQIQRYIKGALNYSAIRPHHLLQVRFPLPVENADDVQDAVIRKLAQIRRIQVHAERQLEAAGALARAVMKEAFDYEKSV